MGWKEGQGTLCGYYIYIDSHVSTLLLLTPLHCYNTGLGAQGQGIVNPLLHKKIKGRGPASGVIVDNNKGKNSLKISAQCNRKKKNYLTLGVHSNKLSLLSFSALC